MRPRRGGSLAVTVIVLLVLDCVIVGTLHLAMLERAMAGSAVDTLRLRLAADEALAAAVAGWDARFDSLPPAGPSLVLRTSDPIDVTVSAERRASLVVLLRTKASLPAPRFGHATAALLVVPPLLPPEFSAAAAIHAGGSVEVRSDGVVTGPDGPAPAAATAIDRLAAAVDLMRGRPSLLITPEAFQVETSFEGVVFSTGDIAIQAGAFVTGLLCALGDVQIEPGATVTGAVLARGNVHVAGAVHFDAAAVEAAIAAARLMKPVPLPGRGRLPAF